MNIVLVGLNHRTAPVEIRERYAVSAAQWRGMNEKLAQQPGCAEAALVSTCNRTELVAVSEDAEASLEHLHAFLRHEIGDGSVEPGQLYELRDSDAVTHVFRVAASLDSMVLGEAQILGQLKAAYRSAFEARCCGPILNRLFQRAFRTAKRVRTETGLGGSPISVARVGVQLAREVFESFEGKRVLLVGAGEMAESALHGLHEAGARHIVVLNRTPATAERLALRLSGRAGPLSSLEEELGSADIAVFSVQVNRPLLGRREAERAMHGRSGQPLLLVDLGLPRNLDASVNEVDDVYLYDIDDLDEIAERGRARRLDAVGPAEAIVRAEVDRYERWRWGLGVVPTIRELLQRAEAIALAEARRAAARLPEATPETEQAVERMAQSIVAKLLHAPLERLREEAQERWGSYYAEAVRDMFGTPEDEG